jgi:hypothetical protein
LLRHQAEPGAEIAAFQEHVSSADRGDHCTCDDRPDAGHAHQPLACRILLDQRGDLAGDALDALVEAAPVTAEVLDNPQHPRRQHIGALGEDRCSSARRKRGPLRTATARHHRKRWKIDAGQ